MALFSLKSKTVVRELILATGNDRDTIHELLLAIRYVWKLCHLVSCSTPRTVVSTTRERGINAGRNDLDVRLRGRRQGATTDAWFTCWWFPPPWGCSTRFIAQPLTLDQQFRFTLCLRELSPAFKTNLSWTRETWFRVGKSRCSRRWSACQFGQIPSSL